MGSRFYLASLLLGSCLIHLIGNFHDNDEYYPYLDDIDFNGRNLVITEDSLNKDATYDSMFNVFGLSASANINIFDYFKDKHISKATIYDEYLFGYRYADLTWNPDVENYYSYKRNGKMNIDSIDHMFPLPPHDYDERVDLADIRNYYDNVKAFGYLNEELIEMETINPKYIDFMKTYECKSRSEAITKVFDFGVIYLISKKYKEYSDIYVPIGFYHARNIAKTLEVAFNAKLMDERYDTVGYDVKEYNEIALTETDMDVILDELKKKDEDMTITKMMEDIKEKGKEAFKNPTAETIETLEKLVAEKYKEYKEMLDDEEENVDDKIISIIQKMLKNSKMFAIAKLILHGQTFGKTRCLNILSKIAMTTFHLTKYAPLMFMGITIVILGIMEIIE